MLVWTLEGHTQHQVTPRTPRIYVTVQLADNDEINLAIDRESPWPIELGEGDLVSITGRINEARRWIAQEIHRIEEPQ
jgi:hypothetical protein